MMELEPAMIYRLDVTGPVEAADGSAATVQTDMAARTCGSLLPDCRRWSSAKLRSFEVESCSSFSAMPWPS